jgi:TolA-binding protein
VDDAAKDSINFKAAQAQYEDGKYDKAVQGFTTYINKFPNGRSRLVAQFNRGESYMVLKDYSNALRDFEYVVNRGPSKYYVKAIEKAAAIAYNHEKDFSKAYNYYTLWEQNADSEQNRFEAQLGALRCAYRLNNQKAVNDLSNKVANNPNASPEQKANANFYLAKIAMDKKDYDSAREAFNKVIKAVDNELAAESRYQIAYIYYLERDLNTALAICERAGQESSAYQYWVAKSVILISDIYVEKGDLVSARAYLEGLLAKYKGDEELINIAKQKKAQLDKQMDANSRLDSGSKPTLEFEDDN